MLISWRGETPHSLPATRSRLIRAKRAAWSGARIILRQTSPESIGIFDFIIGLYESCDGDWEVLTGEAALRQDEMEAWLDYAATFLSNIGNYYGSGDQKFVPAVSESSLKKLANRSPRLRELWEDISGAMLAVPPYGLGYAGINAQSAYYPHGEGGSMTRDEIAAVSSVLEGRSISPENTRVRKIGERYYEVLQASVDESASSEELTSDDGHKIRIMAGDHSEDLSRVCEFLSEASKYAGNDTQRSFLSKYIESFRTGNLEAYRDSQRAWIKDKNPRVENIFGFVEPYRDPYGVRAEFEGLAAISDTEETRVLLNLVDHSDKFIRRLPWVGGEDSVNNGKGHFEKALFEPPDFTSIHGKRYSSPNIRSRKFKLNHTRSSCILFQHCLSRHKPTEL